MAWLQGFFSGEDSDDEEEDAEEVKFNGACV